MSQIVESSFNNYRGMSAKPGFYTASYKLYSIWRRSAVGEKEAETIHPRSLPLVTGIAYNDL